MRSIAASLLRRCNSCCMIGLMIASPAHAEFTELGFLLGEPGFVSAAGISADGSVVVGSAQGRTGIEAFRWSGGTMTGLGSLPGRTDSGALGVSADGSVIVGSSYLISNNRTVGEAFRWSGGTMTGLGSLPGRTGSTARGVSADGSVIVGDSYLISNNRLVFEAFRWSGGTMTGLGFLPGAIDSSATGVSADGGVVVGRSGGAAFRWAGGMMTGLGSLPGQTSSIANGISGDGNVIVGTSGSEAFRWTGGVMSGLGFLSGRAYSQAFGVSADGKVIVGESSADDGVRHAIRWTQSTGMQSLAAWLAANNVNLPVGWQLDVAYATNGDGSVVVGNGRDPAGIDKAWLARVTGVGSGILTDISGYQNSLAEASSHAIQAGASLSNLALFGAHHRSLVDNGLARTRNGACAWATTDAADYNSADARVTLFEAGACKDIGVTRLGAGVGYAQARQDWTHGGVAKYDGKYFLAEAVTSMENGVQASLLGYYGRFDTKLRRNYINGATVDTSSASPNGKSAAFRARLDWKNLTRLGVFDITPYAAYAWTQTKLDAYTETGGGFPATYSASSWRTSDLRIGAAAKTTLSAATDLRLGLEAAHRFDDSSNGVSSSAVGLPGLSFNLAGERVKRTWTRVTLDVDHRLSDSVALTFGINAASAGGDPSWGATAGLRANF